MLTRDMIEEMEALRRGSPKRSCIPTRSRDAPAPSTLPAGEPPRPARWPERGGAAAVASNLADLASGHARRGGCRGGRHAGINSRSTCPCPVKALEGSVRGAVCRGCSWQQVVPPRRPHRRRWCRCGRPVPARPTPRRRRSPRPRMARRRWPRLRPPTRAGPAWLRRPPRPSRTAMGAVILNMTPKDISFMPLVACRLRDNMSFRALT